MKIRIIPVTPFSQNCSLLICESTQKAALVDPGGDIERIFEVINEESVTIEKILLTHGHLDHCGASKEIQDRLNILIEGPHKDDQFWIIFCKLLRAPRRGRAFSDLFFTTRLVV